MYSNVTQLCATNVIITVQMFSFHKTQVHYHWQGVGTKWGVGGGGVDMCMTPVVRLPKAHLRQHFSTPSYATALLTPRWHFWTITPT